MATDPLVRHFTPPARDDLLRLDEDDDSPRAMPGSPYSSAAEVELIRARIAMAPDLTADEWYQPVDDAERARIIARNAPPEHGAIEGDRSHPVDESPAFGPIIGARVDEARVGLRSVATMAAPADVDAWLVEGFARPGTLVVWGATEGLGKSQARTELAIRGATGTGALFGHFRIVRPFRVAVFDEENGAAEEWRRECDILATLGLERAALTGYSRASFAGINLANAGDQAYLTAEIERERPELVVLDTGTSMVGDEWGASLKDAVRFLRGLIARFGITIVVVVHLTKPSRDRKPGSAPHGTALADVMGQWTRSADAVALMADLGDGRARLEMRKKVPPTTLILARRAGVFETVSVGETRKPTSDDRVLRAIAAGADSAEAIEASLGIARRTVFVALQRLRKDGLVAPGVPLECTADGEEAVQ